VSCVPTLRVLSFCIGMVTVANKHNSQVACQFLLFEKNQVDREVMVSRDKLYYSIVVML
jgi:hypothetical protein